MHACAGGIEDNAPVHLPCVGCCCGSHRNRLSKNPPIAESLRLFRHPPTLSLEESGQKQKIKRVGKQRGKAKLYNSQSKCTQHALLPFHPSIPSKSSLPEERSHQVSLVQVTALISLPALALLIVLALLGLVPRVVADRALPLLAEAISTGLLVRLLLLELVGSATESCREVRWKEREAWCGRSLRGHCGGAVSKCREDSRDIRLVGAWSSRLWLLLLVILLLIVVHRLRSLRLRSWDSRLRLELRKDSL
jgi:hypothetical protein